jgi:putative transposase
MNKQHLTLTDDDRRELQTLLSKGRLKALTFKRASALLELDRGKTLVAVAATLGVSSRVVATWRTRYKRIGLKCLNDAPRSGRPTVFDGLQRAKITALATSDTPEGYGRWSLRLLAEKAVESGICDDVSHTFVGDLLKKTTSSRI